MSAGDGIIDTSLSPVGNLGRTTATLLEKKLVATSWQIYIDAGLFSCSVFQNGLHKSDAEMPKLVKSLSDCVLNIIEAALKAYDDGPGDSFVKGETEYHLMETEGTRVFYTATPLGYISSVHSQERAFYYHDRFAQTVSEASFMYRVDARKKWHIRVRPIDTINFTVTTFRLKYSGKQCKGDHLTVSEPGRIMGHYCGERQTWWMETCGNHLIIKLDIVSNQLQIFKALYQVSVKSEICLNSAFNHNTTSIGRLIVPYLGSQLERLIRCKIRIYILTEILNVVWLGVPVSDTIEVYHGRKCNQISLASPTRITESMVIYKSVGFHATLDVEQSRVFSDKVTVVYQITEEGYSDTTPNCKAVFSQGEFHLKAENQYIDAHGRQVSVRPFICSMGFDSIRPMKIKVEKIQIATNTSDDCLDSGFVILDQYQKGIGPFQPQIGPLCGGMTQDMLREAKHIYTMGKMPGHPEEEVTRSVLVALYSYDDEEIHFRATVSSPVMIECVGLFQPCATIEGVPTSVSEVQLLQSYLTFQVIRHSRVHNVSIVLFYMEITPGHCVVFYQFPSFSLDSPTVCIFMVNSYDTKSHIDSRTEPSSYVEPIQAIFQYNLGSSYQCPVCSDNMLLFAASFRYRKMRVGKKRLSLNESFQIHVIPSALAAPTTFRLHLRSAMWLNFSAVSNMMLYVGSESAFISFPFTMGYYRLLFQRRVFAIFQLRSLCDSAHCFFFRKSSTCADSSFMVTNAPNGHALYSWERRGEPKSIVWFTRYDSDFTPLLHYLTAGCEMELYYLNIPHYSISRTERVSNRFVHGCRVEVDDCMFGKCLHLFHVNNSSGSWEDVQNTCANYNMTLPSMHNAEEGNWLRSLINYRWEIEIRGYVLTYLDLQRDDVSKQATQ